VQIPVKYELPITPPKNFYEFSSTWASLEQAPELRAQLIRQIPAAGFAPLFKDSLSPSLLADIVCVLASHILVATSKDSQDQVIAVLQGLATVARFDMLCLCLPPEVKATLNAMFDGALASSADVQALRVKWRV
jgi:hypothetical protein